MYFRVRDLQRTLLKAVFITICILAAMGVIHAVDEIINRPFFWP